MKINDDRHVILAEGNSYPFKEVLREHGFQWNPDLKLWWWDQQLTDDELRFLPRTLKTEGVEYRKVKLSYVDV